MNKRLSSSRYPTSPVKNQPVGVSVDFVFSSFPQYPLAIAGPLSAISPCSYFGNVFSGSFSSTILTSEKQTG